jgi:hypothetical protein
MLRRAGRPARATRRRAGSTGAGRRARGAQAAMETSGAMCSSAAMVAAAGLGVSREEKTDLAFIGSRDAQRRLLGHQVVTRSRYRARHGPGGGDVRRRGRPMA